MCQNIITQCAFIVVDEHVLCAVFLTFLMSMPPVFRRSHCDGKHKRVHQYAVWRNYAPEFDVTRARSLFSCIVADERHILTQYCDVTWTRGEITSPSIHSLPYRKICCDFLWYVVMFSWLAKQCMSNVHCGCAGELNQLYSYVKAPGKVIAISLKHITITSGLWNKFV